MRLAQHEIQGAEVDASGELVGRGGWRRIPMKEMLVAAGWNKVEAEFLHRNSRSGVGQVVWSGREIRQQSFSSHAPPPRRQVLVNIGASATVSSTPSEDAAQEAEFYFRHNAQLSDFDIASRISVIHVRHML